MTGTNFKLWHIVVLYPIMLVVRAICAVGKWKVLAALACAALYAAYRLGKGV